MKLELLDLVVSYGVSVRDLYCCDHNNRNCAHFCNVLCHELGVGEVPNWVPPPPPPPPPPPSRSSSSFP
eukprot:COSAG05_NODE_4257_length_1595_cov_4.658422_4_plen_68_part_01